MTKRKWHRGLFGGFMGKERAAVETLDLRNQEYHNENTGKEQELAAAATAVLRTARLSDYRFVGSTYYLN